MLEAHPQLGLGKPALGLDLREVISTVVWNRLFERVVLTMPGSGSRATLDADALTTFHEFCT